MINRGIPEEWTRPRSEKCKVGEVRLPTCAYLWIVLDMSNPQKVIIYLQWFET